MKLSAAASACLLFFAGFPAQAQDQARDAGGAPTLGEITVSTPAWEEKVSLMISYFSGSFMLIRNEAGSWSGVTESTIGELENCSLKCL